MRRTIVLFSALILAIAVVLSGAAGAPNALLIEEFVVPTAAMEEIRSDWVESLLAHYPAGSWAPLGMELDDSHLALMGLPPRDVLLAQRYPEPTMVLPSGSTEVVSLPSVSTPAGTLGPTVASFAGAGWFGIRPGAFLLLLNGGSIGWCSMAHVFGSPGSFKISTAGHCGKVGDKATVVAALGNRNGVLNPILLDFGKFSASTSGGLGKDWSLISVDSSWQNLVTPTMAFWGGPRGMYTKTGSTAKVTFPRNRLIPSVSVSTDPLLAQAIVHYGHGAGVGTGGTPRSGSAIHWGTSHYMFFGAISPGDSGSGANTLLGDTVGANMEAAGIMTHLYIDPLMRQGLGIMGGTRATLVSSTLANGQIVPYPIPISGLP